MLVPLLLATVKGSTQGLISALWQWDRPLNKAEKIIHYPPPDPLSWGRTHCKPEVPACRPASVWPYNLQMAKSHKIDGGWTLVMTPMHFVGELVASKLEIIITLCIVVVLAVQRFFCIWRTCETPIKMPFLVSKNFPSKGILLTNFCKGEEKDWDDNLQLFCMDCLMTDSQSGNVRVSKTDMGAKQIWGRRAFPPYLGAVLIKH